MGKVERPVGVFVVPAIGSSDGWQLTPVLALDTIRLIAELGGRLERDLRSAVIPIGSREALLERINVHTLHAGPRECLDSAGQLAQELSRELGVPVSPGRATRQARPVGPARRPPPLLQERRRHEHGRARAPGAHVPGARVHPAAARVGAARGAVTAARAR